ETKIVEVPSREPAPWGDDAELHVVGKSVPRMDALEKITGDARYTADMQLPRMLYAALLRAPVARGRVVSIDLSPALALDGVRGAVTSDDVPDIKLDGISLFDHTIHYAHQPIAAICADSLEIAERALRAIEVDVKLDPHVANAHDALSTDAPRIRSTGNMPRRSPRVASRGDVAAGLEAADVTITREYRTPVALHTALEPHGAVADWSGGFLTVWESTQGIFMTRADVASAFELPLSKVRVIKNYMGGGFGSKNGASHATYAACALARKLGQPVRCIFDREGEQSDAGNRPSTVQQVTLGATRDGRLTAIKLASTTVLGIGGWLSG